MAKVDFWNQMPYSFIMTTEKKIKEATDKIIKEYKPEKTILLNKIKL